MRFRLISWKGLNWISLDEWERYADSKDRYVIGWGAEQQLVIKSGEETIFDYCGDELLQTYPTVYHYLYCLRDDYIAALSDICRSP